MALNLGESTTNVFYLGNMKVTRAYFGSKLVYNDHPYVYNYYKPTKDYDTNTYTIDKSHTCSDSYIISKNIQTKVLGNIVIYHNNSCNIETALVDNIQTSLYISNNNYVKLNKCNDKMMDAYSKDSVSRIYDSIKDSYVKDTNLNVYDSSNRINKVEDEIYATIITNNINKVEDISSLEEIVSGELVENNNAN